MKITKRVEPVRTWKGVCHTCSSEAEEAEDKLTSIRTDFKEGTQFSQEKCPVCGATGNGAMLFVHHKIDKEGSAMHKPYKVNPAILLRSGNYFDLLNPEQSVFTVEDIAHSLSNICRFTGHTNQFYSVAQHSVLVSTLLPPELALRGLLHDSAEAVIGDIATPLKQLLPDYLLIEHRVEQAIWHRLQGFSSLPKEVKEADLRALATERRDLMSEQESIWGILEGVTPVKEIIVPLPPADAFSLFMSTYEGLIT